MDKRRGIDLCIACICAAIMAISWFYIEEENMRFWVLAVSGAAAVFFALLAAVEKGGGHRGRRETEMLPGQPGMISEIVLLSEEGNELMLWDMYGRTALVIGRAGKESQADIDLSSSPYAGMVDEEHAVLNFSGGNWYIEDLGSENGLSIKKRPDGRVYRLAAKPCILEAGDQILVGMNHLLVR
ncbi:MAG: FHA domain-containing protein [Kineothrix sp.]